MKLVIKVDTMKLHVILVVFIISLNFIGLFGRHSMERGHRLRYDPRYNPYISYPPVGTLNNLQIQTNNTVLNTLTNTLLPGVFGNASGIFFNGTILG